MTRGRPSRNVTWTARQGRSGDMCRNFESGGKAEGRPGRCRTCTKPYEGGGCPGNQGIGCIGDWRCCLEMDTVCRGCTEHGEEHLLWCTRTECGKMAEFFRKK